jgi:hypothetical protein
MAAFCLAGVALGVDDQLDMPHDPPQPAGIQAPGRFDKHRFGLDRDLGGELVGAVGQDGGVGGGVAVVRA